MRMMMKVSVPVEGGNKALSDGSLAETIMGFVEQHKPEATYFFAEEGRRTTMFIVDMKDPSDMVTWGEPFFMTMNASISVTPAMNIEDLKNGMSKMSAGK